MPSNIASAELTAAVVESPDIVGLSFSVVVCGKVRMGLLANAQWTWEEYVRERRKYRRNIVVV
jgi:hypothetical protein